MMGRFLDALKAGMNGFKEANEPRGFSVGARWFDAPLWRIEVCA
jgi:hypothetical protein